MNKLSSDDIFRLAKSSPIFAELIKSAANGAVFNESVPGSQGGAAGPNDGGTGYPSNTAPAGVVPPAGGDKPPEEEEYAAVPQEAGAQVAPEQETPEAVGARAAQAFLGPIMEGAMQGDPNAQDIVAKAAGNVAGAVAAQYSKSMAGSPAVAGEAGAMPGAEPMAPPAITTPEEDLANQIVQAPAPVQAPGQTPAPGGQVPPKDENGEEEELDENGQPIKKKKPPFPPKK